MCSTGSVLSLESILDNPASDLFKDFAAYLNDSYCIENLEFWLATQDYYEECNKEDLANVMINLYIKPNSPQEINIPCEMRQTILDYYQKGNFHLHLFDDAAEAVLELMRVNSFLPWITTCSFHKKLIQSPSTSSLSSLTGSKWNLKKLKQQSRRSCSSLDYTFVDNNSVISGTRYKAMLKKVKKSLLGQSMASTKDDQSEYYTPRASSDTATSTIWKKSQR